MPAGGGGGAELVWCGVVPVSVGCGVSCPWVKGGSAVWPGGARLRDGLSAWGGGVIVCSSGGVGGCSWLVLGPCGAVSRGLSVVPLVFFSSWAARDRCGEEPGAPWGRVCGIGLLQPGGVVGW